LFYGLYAVNQEWWFLVICLSGWAFILVAASFALSGREFLFPVALVTSFIGECCVTTVLCHMLVALSLLEQRLSHAAVQFTTFAAHAHAAFNV
jgi:hypothetical protein